MHFPIATELFFDFRTFALAFDFDDLLPRLRRVSRVGEAVQESLKLRHIFPVAGGFEGLQCDPLKGLVPSLEFLEFGNSREQDVVICTQRDYKVWGRRGGRGELPAGYLHAENVRRRSFDFEAPRDGSFVVLLINWSDEETEATIDWAWWDGDEEE